MISKIFELLYVKIFVNIVVGHTSTKVYIEVCKNKKNISYFEETFPTTNFSNEMEGYIQEFIKESPYHYISFLDTSVNQGAIPTCDQHHPALVNTEHKCINKQWSFYTAQTNRFTLEKKYKRIGVDFLFSPFTILQKFFQDKIEKGLAMFVLLEEGYISVAIFDHSKLLFAKHLDLQHHIEEETHPLLNLEEEEELENFNLDDEEVVLDDLDIDESFENFADIEDLDSLEEIDEFSNSKDFEEELYENDLQLESNGENTQEGNHNNFNEEYQRFTLLQNALHLYYQDSTAPSEFIENIYIANAISVSGDLKHFLEEELFLNVYVRTIDLGYELSQLAQEELGL